MSIFHKLFSHKTEAELGKPEWWDEDEAFVRDADGHMVKVAEEKEDAGNDQKEQP